MSIGALILKLKAWLSLQILWMESWKRKKKRIKEDEEGDEEEEGCKGDEKEGE